jgi:hypothetical protein
MAEPETPQTPPAAEPGLAEQAVLIPEIITQEDLDREHMLTKRLQGSTRLLPQIVSMMKDPKAGEEAIQKYFQLVQMFRASAVRNTFASDWVLNFVENEGRVISTGYLQDVGCERATQILGVTRVSVTKGPTREDLKDNTYIMRAEADFFCESTREFLPQVRGSRWSGEGFFKGLAAKMGGVLNPVKVEEACLRNMHGRAVRTLGGLASVPQAYLEAMGIDSSHCHIIKWKGAREAEPGAAPQEGASRGRTARQDLAELLRTLAGGPIKLPGYLRALCKENGIAEKDSVADLTESQVADLLIIARERKAP